VQEPMRMFVDVNFLRGKKRQLMGQNIPAKQEAAGLYSLPTGSSGDASCLSCEFHMADILKFFFTFCQDDSILFSGSNMFLYGR
jgi:hypothetical protein